MTPEKKLEVLLEEAGRGSKAKLAKFLDVSPVYVTRWVTDEKYNIPREQLNNIEKFFNLPHGFLLADENKKSVRSIKIIGTASCGGSEINYMQDGERFCYYNGDYFKNSLYCVIANGDSMAPEIEDGDEIVCDPDVKPQSGDIVHYTIHGESAVKVFVEDKDANIIQLVPYNATNTFKTRTIRLDDDEAEDLKLSKVVAVNKLKFNNRASRLRLIGRL
ncbi:MAG: XRE family transcriptional regulator [Sulfurimonadaceae bacterium]